MISKQQLRKWAKEKRKELNMADISAILSDKLVQTDEYKNAKNIMLFYPMPEEVNLLSLLNDNSKNFYLPRIKDKKLECCPYCAEDELCESGFHTQEPTCQACNKKVLDLVIVPALACDKNGYRLGYGGGFYDRFLQDFGGTKVVCISKILTVDSICPEEYDIPMDLIITD